MSPKLKIVAMLAMSSALIAFPDLRLISAVSAALAALIASFRLSRRFLSWLKPMLLVFVVVVLLQSVELAAPVFTASGFLDGMMFSLRIFALVSAVFLLVETTPAGRLHEAFFFLPGTMRHLMAMALAMLPWISELAGNVMNAQRARGIDFRSPNLSRTYVPLLVPMFAKTLDRSERMALAMEARGFGSD